MQNEKLKLSAKFQLKKHARSIIKIVIPEVLREHVHMIVDLSRILSIAMPMDIIKGLSIYIIFRRCPDFRIRCPRDIFGAKYIFAKAVELFFKGLWII